ncbi:MAG: VOC family protein [Chloroflexi bacterium]|nr:VOC family protein [Chloroflexota bacterium]
MSITRVHHVGLVNGDLEHSRHILVDGFGLSLDEHRTPLPQGRPGYDGTTILEFPIGELYYEVAKPNDFDSEPAQYLASTNGRGGIYYISLATNDIAGDIQGILSRGGKLKGDWDGNSPVFLDPTTSLGLRIQITPEDNYFVHPYFRGNGTCTGLGHVGVAARDPEESRRFWGSILGIREDRATERGAEPPDPNRPSQAADDPVHIIEYPIGGTVIEISHPTTTDSGTARLVAQRATLGAVYHHTAPFTPNVHRFVEQAVPAGMEQIGRIPPREESTRVIAWFHPRSCLGMLLEAWNRPPGGEHYQPQS